MTAKRLATMLAIAAAALPGAAPACDIAPDWVLPSREERWQTEFEHSKGIVRAVVTRAGRNKIPFRVLHVYKGALRPGARLTLRPEIRGCPVPGRPDRTARGTAGVIRFTDSGTFAFLSEQELENMFEKGWIQRAGRGN